MPEYTRRSFVKFASAAGMVALGGGVFALAGCGEQQAASSSALQQAEGASAAESVSAAESASAANASAGEGVAGAEASAGADARARATAAVVFYSRAGENYNVGVVDEGNTAKLAKEIAAQTGAVLVEVVPAEAYPEGYDDCCDVALAEQEEGARPALAQMPDLSAYETIYLGFPIWWGDLPMFMYTLLEAADWSGKVVAPFNTHEGSGVSGTNASIAAACKGADVRESLAMRGTTAQESPDEVKDAVADWLDSIGVEHATA